MELLNKFGIHQSSLNPVHHRFVGIAGKSLGPVGAKQVRLKLEGRQCEEDITFCENIRHQYLSFNACKALGIVHHDLPLPLKQSGLAIRGALTELDVRSSNIPPRPSDEEIEKTRSNDQHYNEEQSSSEVVDIFMDKIRNASSDDEEIKCLKSTITEDLFSFGGKVYLAVADRFSGYPFIAMYKKEPDSSEEVLVQNNNTKKWDSTAVVLGKNRYRSYQLRFPSGRVLWRNRKHLRPKIKSTLNNCPQPSHKTPSSEVEGLRRSTRLLEKSIRPIK
ncbi:hypothetical protein TCAL_10442 [Tigriopus californicus]|uniref:Uncharacterized protein n=1 Tax=Tigriopus californicus TaxID=6832 RepID=A0A553PU70_TIGCA|nr:hypothetical protein TCAL_10442 [Tigriopus californicus]